MQHPVNLNAEIKLPQSLRPGLILIGSLALFLLCSCGNRGPLYLPANDQEAVISQPAPETPSETMADRIPDSDEDDSTDGDSGQ